MLYLVHSEETSGDKQNEEQNKKLWLQPNHYIDHLLTGGHIDLHCEEHALFSYTT